MWAETWIIHPEMSYKGQWTSKTKRGPITLSSRMWNHGYWVFPFSLPSIRRRYCTGPVLSPSMCAGRGGSLFVPQAAAPSRVDRKDRHRPWALPAAVTVEETCMSPFREDKTHVHATARQKSMTRPWFLPSQCPDRSKPLKISEIQLLYHLCHFLDSLLTRWWQQPPNQLRSSSCLLPINAPWNTEVTLPRDKSEHETCNVQPPLGFVQPLNKDQML